jgi:hypothetical protein
MEQNKLNIFLNCEKHERCVVAAVCYSFRTILGEFVNCIKSMKAHADKDGFSKIAIILDENIREELGQVGYDTNTLEKYHININSVNNVSHRELLDLFVNNIRKCLTEEEKETADKIEGILLDTAQKWRSVYVSESDKSLVNGMGAMCFGCELILPSLFQKLITLIKSQFPDLCEDDLAYLYVHVFVDVEHGKVLSSIADSLCEQDENNILNIETSLQRVKDASDKFWTIANLQNKKS